MVRAISYQQTLSRYVQACADDIRAIGRSGLSASNCQTMADLTEDEYVSDYDPIGAFSRNCSNGFRHVLCDSFVDIVQSMRPNLDFIGDEIH